MDTSLCPFGVCIREVPLYIHKNNALFSASQKPALQYKNGLQIDSKY